MHNILEFQNSRSNILRLAAQRQLYKKAKLYLTVQLIITVPITIIIAFLKLIPENTICFRIDIIAPIIGMMITIIDYLIGQFIVSYFKTQAAKVQEEFDCSVFEMAWDNISVGSKVASETISEYGSSISNSELEKLMNWYPTEIEKYDKELAILQCQKASLHYDKSLKRKYLWSFLTLFFIVTFLIMLPVVNKDLHIGIVISQVLCPLLPILYITLKVVVEYLKMIKSLDSLHTTITKIENSTSLPKPEELRTIQTRIYTLRKDGPLVPEFFYKLKRKKLEKNMHENLKTFEK